MYAVFKVRELDVINVHTYNEKITDWSVGPDDATLLLGTRGECPHGA